MSLLNGIKVIELDGYLPSCFLGKSLRDLGAIVYLIRPFKGNQVMKAVDYLNDGKIEVFLNLKDEGDKRLLLKMLEKADVLVDGYRPGVLEKLGLCPKMLLCKVNSELIVTRVTGYGQSGLMALQPGHEINYLSLSGMLDYFKDARVDRILNPMIIIGDLFCGSLLPLYHLTQTLLNRQITGKGCIIDTSITTNLLSLTNFIKKSQSEEMIYFIIRSSDKQLLLLSISRFENTIDILKNAIYLLTKDPCTEGNNEQELINILKSLTINIDSKTIITELEKLKIQISPILLYKDLLNILQTNNFIDADLQIKTPFNNIVSSNRTQSRNIDTASQLDDKLIDLGLSTNDIKEYRNKNLARFSKF
jgi:crotonobetainyl-CoA:carnitine CoA-transferase CaiB-like acyl-CoA transferase